LGELIHDLRKEQNGILDALLDRDQFGNPVGAGGTVGRGAEHVEQLDDVIDGRACLSLAVWGP